MEKIHYKCILIGSNPICPPPNKIKLIPFKPQWSQYKICTSENLATVFDISVSTIYKMFTTQTKYDMLEENDNEKYQKLDIT